MVGQYWKIGSGPIVLVLLAASLAQSASARGTGPEVKALLDRAITAQGGSAALLAMRTVTVEAQGYRNMLEQSERPEGPYIVEYNDLRETRDHIGARYRSVTESTVPGAYRYAQGIVADRTAAIRLLQGKPSRADQETLAAAREALALSPERLLLTARDANDVAVEPPEMLQAVPQDVISFTLDGAVARLFLNRYTHLPTALDYDGALARTGYWQRLGDVRMRILYSTWALGQHDVRMPMQWDIYRNDQHDSSYAVSSLAFDPPPENDMAIPAELRLAFARAQPDTVLGRPDQPPVDVAPGVTIIPGAWNVAIVRQDDGVVIVEAPISSAYSEKVMAEAARRYPDVPVKAVVTTSDSWPHIAGLRSYVARGIPVYGLDLNRPIIERLVAASYTSKPDALQRQPRLLNFAAVAGKVVIGGGANRLEIYPLRGETSERQAMVYWPVLHLLYGSDPFQELSHSAQTVSELADAVAREHLTPDRFYMMHVAPTPWQALVAATRSSAAKQFPTGSSK